MLELARGVGLGVDVGDLLELQGALHAERVFEIPADEEDGIVVEVLRGVILDLLAVRQDLLDLRGQRGDGAHAVSHPLEPLFVQTQPVEHDLRDGAARSLQIEAVRRQNGL